MRPEEEGSTYTTSWYAWNLSNSTDDERAHGDHSCRLHLDDFGGLERILGSFWVDGN